MMHRLSSALSLICSTPHGSECSQAQLNILGTLHAYGPITLYSAIHERVPMKVAVWLYKILLAFQLLRGPSFIDINGPATHEHFNL